MRLLNLPNNKKTAYKFLFACTLTSTIFTGISSTTATVKDPEQRCEIQEGHVDDWSSLFSNMKRSDQLRLTQALTTSIVPTDQTSFAAYAHRTLQLLGTDARSEKARVIIALSRLLPDHRPLFFDQLCQIITGDMSASTKAYIADLLTTVKADDRPAYVLQANRLFIPNMDQYNKSAVLYYLSRVQDRALFEAQFNGMSATHMSPREYAYVMKNLVEMSTEERSLFVSQIDKLAADTNMSADSKGRATLLLLKVSGSTREQVINKAISGFSADKDIVEELASLIREEIGEGMVWWNLVSGSPCIPSA